MMSRKAIVFFAKSRCGAYYLAPERNGLQQRRSGAGARCRQQGDGRLFAKGIRQ